MVVRTRDKAAQQYEGTWQEVLETARALVESGETSLARAVSLLEHAQNVGAVPAGTLDDAATALLDLPKDEAGNPYYKLVCVRGRYVPVPRHYCEETIIWTVAGRMTEETDAVVELGSGWGKNLFKVFLRNRFSRVRYFACELTEAGRRATELIAGLDPGIDLTVRPFDYHEPDLSFLEGRENVVFFTNNSIEQIAFFNPRLLDLMMERTEGCVCVHMEPVGWQRHRELAQHMNRLAREGTTAGGGQLVIGEIDQAQFMQNFANYVLSAGYNVDYLGVLHDYERAGRIRIRETEYDIFGENPFCPSTLIVWEKSRAA